MQDVHVSYMLQATEAIERRERAPRSRAVAAKWNDDTSSTELWFRPKSLDRPVHTFTSSRRPGDTRNPVSRGLLENENFWANLLSGG